MQLIVYSIAIFGLGVIAGTVYEHARRARIDRATADLLEVPAWVNDAHFAPAEDAS